MTKSELAFIYKDLIKNNPDIEALCVDELGSPLYFYVNIDINRLDDIKFPYCHLNGISKNENKTQNNFLVVMGISALLNDEAISSEETTNDTSKKIEKVIKAISDYLTTSTFRGLGGEKCFEIDSINEVAVFQDGQNDTQHIIEFDVSQKKCKY